MNVRHRLVGFGAAVAAALPFESFAAQYVWTENASASATWETAANWDGPVPDPRSTSSADLAEPVEIDFGTLATYQKIQGWNFRSQSNKYLHFDRLVSAGAPREIQLSSDGNGARGMLLFLRDVSDFNGYFTVDPRGGSSGTSPGAAVIFRATESYTPQLRYLMGTLPFTYCVPTEGKVLIDNVLGGGRFRLNDASSQGVVEFTSSPGGETSPYLNGGTLVLHGATAAAETVLERAALHLDASAADTLSFDGPYVSGWTDPVRQITVVPEQSGASRPTVTNDFANALPAVNFGRFSGVVQYGNSCVTNNGNYTSWAGQPSRLRLPQALTGVKELFVVWRDWYRAQSPSYFVGTDVASDNVFHRTQGGNGLFASTAATSQIQQGETRLNGQRVLARQGINSYANVYVASASVGADCAGGKVEYVGGGMGLFATEMPNRGGLAIGEIILFAETLTPAERRAVNAYLKQKWLVGRDAADLDLGTLTAVDGATVEVAEGVAEIAELDMAAGSTLVKQGAGDLFIGQLAHDGITFDVREGRVVLKRNAKPLGGVDVSGYLPPSDAHLWLDASVPNSLVADGDGRISKWNDVREGKNEGGTYACAEPTVKSNVRVGADATVVDGAAPSGLPVFDTGVHEDAETAAAFTLKVNGNEIGRDLQEIFVVARLGEKGGVLFGGSNLDLNGMSAEQVILDSYSSRYAEAAHVSVDGVTVDPINGPHDPTRFQVYSIAASGPLSWNGLANDRGGGLGGCQYGEILVYSRCLTADERREVTEYLMKKWLNREHPDTLASQSTATLAIVAGKTETVVLDANGDPVINRRTNAAADVLAKAWAHYDATVASTFESSLGDGRYRQWYDSLDPKKLGDNCLLNWSTDQWPTRREVVVNGGKTMPVVDFGVAQWGTPYSPNLTMNKADTNKDAEEIYVIHADSQGNGTGILGAKNGTVTDAMGKYLWRRPDPGPDDGGCRKILDSYSPALYNGIIRVNGQTSNASFVPETDRYYLYTFIPTIPVTANCVGYTFAGGGSTFTGGAKYGEILFYKGANKNTPEEQAKIEAYLMKKWFDQGYGPKCDLGALALTGERVAYSDEGGGADYELASLAGEGAVDFGVNPVSGLASLAPTDVLSVKATSTTLSDSLSLNIAFSAKDVWGRVELDGTVALPANAVVSVSVPADVCPRATRLYQLLTADAVTGDISNWKLNVSCAQRPDARLVQKADGVYLEFVSSGTIVILR